MNLGSSIRPRRPLRREARPRLADVACLGAAIALTAAATRPASRAAGPNPAPAVTAPARGAVQPGATAPLFSASRLDGGTLSLASLRGHVVLLDFWAVDCPPCRIEMPA